MVNWSVLNSDVIDLRLFKLRNEKNVIIQSETCFIDKFFKIIY